MAAVLVVCTECQCSVEKILVFGNGKTIAMVFNFVMSYNLCVRGERKELNNDARSRPSM